jgi:hypothetical protein
MYTVKVNDNTQRVSLFPSLVYNINIAEVVDDIRNILPTVKWRMPDDNRSASESFFFLNEHEHLKNTFTEKVNAAISEIKYAVPLKMTTSWFYRLKPGAKHFKHHHVNSFWSASFYFEEGEMEALNICSSKGAPSINVPFYTEDLGIIPFGTIGVPAQCGKLILFPSHMQHWVNRNSFDKTRHVLAMNFMPDGETGELDSTFTY